MKPLLMCASSSRTGPVEGLISLAAELRKLGVFSHFAGDTVRPGENLAGHLKAAGVPWETELRLSRKVKVSDVFHDVRLLKSWNPGRFDVLHAAFAHDHALALWARRKGAIVVRAVQRRIDVEPGLFGQRLFALRKSDGVVTHSQAYRKLLLQHLPEDRVAYVPPSVDAARFSPGGPFEPSGEVQRSQAAWALRERWGVPLDAPLVGIVARMKPERGHRQLLRAFAIAAREVPEAFLVLVGRGEDEPALRQLAASLAPARIVFGGYARGPDLVEAYRALDVAVWLREGNDGATRGVLEAMACGVPVIAGNEGAPGELVRDGLDGAVVPPANEPAITQALVSLLSNPKLARARGASARARALELTPARAAADTLAFWQRLRGGS
ncbi:MAG TPA: glycosyltransferase family 4 protein [Myxococcales bacterium]|nr:glycosyltransferase family 4 protein [Myxococcales bacterium]